MKDYRRLLSGLMAAVMVMSQSAGVLAAEGETTAPDTEYADQAVVSEETDSLEACGFPGGYALSEKDRELKADMAANDMVGELLEKEEGKDYHESQIWYLADSQEEADRVAAAYGATVVNYSYGVATAELKNGMSVLDAVSAASDPNSQLPPVEPVYIWRIEPDMSYMDDSGDSLDSVGAITVDDPLSWRDFVNDDPYCYDVYGEKVTDPVLDNPDPFLTDPSNHNDNETEYQYQHDQVNTWAAWGSSIGSSNVKVAVVDTGVLQNHEDFIDPGTGECYVKKAIDVTKDQVGVVSGEHGTHVAGIIAAAVNNGKGGAGIAPGVSIYSYNVCFSYEGVMNDDDIVRGINAAIADKVDIINMSLGGPDYSAQTCEIMKNAYKQGICVFAAAGNNFSNAKNYPAGYCTVKDAGVISVGATSYDGKKAPYSQCGSWVTICAPGTKIRSTVPAFLDTDNPTAHEIEPGSDYHRYEVDTLSTNKYEQMSGTSMATPVATGVAALYLSAYGTKLSGTKDLRGSSELPKKMKSLMTTYGTSVSNLGKRVNVGAMFGGEKKAPAIVPYDKNGKEIQRENPKKSVYRNVFVVMLSSQATLSGNMIHTNSKKYYNWDKEKIYFTIDAEAPEVDPKTLELKSGRLYDGRPLVIQNYKPGSKHVIRALAVTSEKKVTGVSSITVYAPEADKTVSVNPAVKKITLSANSTSDPAKYGKNASKKSILFVRDDMTPITTDTIYPELTFADGSTAKTGDFAKKSVINAMYWASSNSDVVYVEKNDDGSCYLQPLKKGSCKVTLYVYSYGKVQKSQGISVTVKEAVTQIEISGLASIDPGTSGKAKSAKYKATCLPKTASNKKVEWYLLDKKFYPVSEIDVNGGKATIDKNGKLTLSAGVKVKEPAETFSILALDADTHTAFGYKEVTIGAKETESIIIKLSETSLSENTLSGNTLSGNKASQVQPTSFQAYENKEKKIKYMDWKDNGSLKLVTLANVDLASTPGNDNRLVLTSGNTSCVWTSSNDKVVKVVSYSEISGAGNIALIYGLKAGSATVTAKASDGSGKSASVKVNVKIPVSGIGLGINNNSYNYTLAVGKSVTPSAYVGKTYGTPSRTTLEWDFVAGYVTEDLSDMKDRKAKLNNPDEALTSLLYNNKAVTVDSKTGKLTISKKNWNTALNDKVYVRVIAKATDGTEYSDYANYVVTTPATGIKAYLLDQGKLVEVQKGESFVFPDSKTAATLFLVVEGQGSNNNNLQFGGISITSSKPEYGAPHMGKRVAHSEQLGTYGMVVYLSGGEKKGSANITFKATDGTGKSLSFKAKTLESAVK